ncbi:Ppx/GppA family phosphatase [Spirillospora sp. CA-294931]|uniref:Ppx/GppA phosphatase family protein n=1 Tax=Spirillospora sp. CA-294931 TaxID=3240042 RepID=UPI003D8B16E6
MRIGVLDVGSNSAHLKVMDVHPGRPLVGVATVKHPTRLAEAIARDGTVAERAVCRLAAAVREAVAAAEDQGVDELVAFATSAVRDAANREAILTRVEAATGVRLKFLTGPDEARLTFLAARSWYGWSAGRLLLADIGGGSLEVAYGDGEEPALALSLPLGAGRLTRELLPDDPPRRKHVRRLRARVREELGEAMAGVAAELDGRPPLRPVATSKTFTQLARLTGAPRYKEGPYVRRTLELERLREQIPVLSRLDRLSRAKLRGVSRPRAHQILAGAVVAESLMTVLRLERLDICPWALREGIVTRHLQAMTASALEAGTLGSVA